MKTCYNCVFGEYHPGEYYPMEPKTAWFGCTKQDWSTKKVQADPVWADPVVDEDNFNCEHWMSAEEVQLLQAKLAQVYTKLDEAYKHASLMQVEANRWRRVAQMKSKAC
jgi:hypothetical protein